MKDQNGQTRTVTTVTVPNEQQAGVCSSARAFRGNFELNNQGERLCSGLGSLTVTSTFAPRSLLDEILAGHQQRTKP